jgi:hypothetical protein
MKKVGYLTSLAVTVECEIRLKVFTGSCGGTHSTQETGQEDCKFQATLNAVARPCLKKEMNNNETFPRNGIH